MNAKTTLFAVRPLQWVVFTSGKCLRLMTSKVKQWAVSRKNVECPTLCVFLLAIYFFYKNKIAMPFFEVALQIACNS